jgi:hypothetical protein
MSVPWLNGAYGSVPHAEWFTHVKHLLRATHEAPGIIDDLAQFGNPVISIHAELHKRGLVKP